MLDIIQKFMEQNRKWTDETFPGQSVISTLDHCRSEVTEVKNAIDNGESSKEILFEFADVYLLLLNSLSKQGYTFEQLHNAAEEKMIINRSRKWAINGEGFPAHIKQSGND